MDDGGSAERKKHLGQIVEELGELAEDELEFAIPTAVFVL